MSEIKKDLFEKSSSNQIGPQSRKIKLSPSSLNLFMECPRCFWLYINREMKRPSIPVATITTGLDRVVKEYLSEYRLKNILPSFLKEKISGKLMVDFPKRGWFEYNDARLDAKLGGYLDECIQLEDGNYAVLDHKTRGSAPDSVHKAYQLQMDVYTFLLEANKYPTKRTAYLAYYIPKKIIANSDFQFEVVIKEISTDPKRAQEVFSKAVEILRKPIPSKSEDCDFCKWTSTAEISN